MMFTAKTSEFDEDRQYSSSGQVHDLLDVDANCDDTVAFDDSIDEDGPGNSGGTVVSAVDSTASATGDCCCSGDSVGEIGEYLGDMGEYDGENGSIDDDTSLSD